MHPLAVEEIVKVCRQREREGDCPTEPPFGREVLEDAILALAVSHGWTDRERVVLRELSLSRDLSEHAVLRQALRWYQVIVRMVEEGFPVVRFQAYDGTLKPQDSKLPYAIEMNAENAPERITGDKNQSLWQQHEYLAVVIINLRIALRDAVSFRETIEPNRLEILLTEVDRALATERNTSYQAGYKDGKSEVKD